MWASETRRAIVKRKDGKFDIALDVELFREVCVEALNGRTGVESDGVEPYVSYMSVSRNARLTRSRLRGCTA